MLPVIIVIGQTLDPNVGIQRAFKGGAWQPTRSYPYVNPTEDCQVKNVNTTVDYMVPYRSAKEWAAFKYWTTSGDKKDLTYDCSGCVALDCTQKDELAAVNQGYNCGLTLQNGCGGTINCIGYCNSGEVCAVGGIGSDCALGKLHMCDQGETIGHCRVDNSCYPVVDVPALGGPYGRMGCLISGPYTYRNDACSSGLATPSYALYYRGVDCYVGNFTGGSLNTCANHFFSNEYKYYVIDDDVAILPPLVTYSLYGSPSGINLCPEGSGDGCLGNPCYQDCILYNSPGFCETECGCAIMEEPAG